MLITKNDLPWAHPKQYAAGKVKWKWMSHLLSHFMDDHDVWERFSISNLAYDCRLRCHCSDSEMFLFIMWQNCVSELILLKSNKIEVQQKKNVMCSFIYIYNFLSSYLDNPWLLVLMSICYTVTTWIAYVIWNHI